MKFFAKKFYCNIIFLFITVCLTVSGLSPPAFAGKPTDQMKQTIDAVIKVLENKELKKSGREAERRAEIGKILDARFDFRAMAKSALSIYWSKRTPAEKKEFVSLFTDLIKDTYIRKMERYGGEKVSYVGESTNDGYARIKTRVILKTGTEIPIDYMLRNKNGIWMAYDVFIEGVSLVNNYRSQFAEIIDSSSYEELIRKLRNKVIKEPK